MNTSAAGMAFAAYMACRAFGFFIRTTIWLVIMLFNFTVAFLYLGMELYRCRWEAEERAAMQALRDKHKEILHD